MAGVRSDSRLAPRRFAFARRRLVRLGPTVSRMGNSDQTHCSSAAPTHVTIMCIQFGVNLRIHSGGVGYSSRAAWLVREARPRDATSQTQSHFLKVIHLQGQTPMQKKRDLVYRYYFLRKGHSRRSFIIPRGSPEIYGHAIVQPLAC